jgi:hypothetical protein
METAILSQKHGQVIFQKHIFNLLAAAKLMVPFAQNNDLCT